LTFQLHAGKARGIQGLQFQAREQANVFWGGLIVLTVAVLFLLYGLFRWASKDPGIDREIAKQRFQAEQDLRSLNRSGGSGSTSTQDSDRLPDRR
jgi:uncharacterized membrane protein